MLQIGMVIKAWRSQNGLTQAEAAYVIGISRETLNRWEHGRQSPRLPAQPGRPRKIFRWVYREQHEVRRPGRGKWAIRMAHLELVDWTLEEIKSYAENRRNALTDSEKIQFDINHKYDGLTENEKISFDSQR